jgi:outer membrane protein assembly factor BamB
VAPKTGEVLWTRNEGGYSQHFSASTPAVDGDLMAVTGTWGVRFYKLSLEKAELLREAACLKDYAASPIITGAHAYIMGRRGTSCVSIETGDIVWQDRALMAGSYAAPILVDGKVLVQGNKRRNYGDGSLAMFLVSPAKGRLLAQADIKQTLTTTPAVVDGRVYCRLVNRLACYDLRK